MGAVSQLQHSNSAKSDLSVHLIPPDGAEVYPRHSDQAKGSGASRPQEPRWPRRPELSYEKASDCG